MFKHAEQALRFAFRMREKAVLSRPSLVPHEKNKNAAEKLSAHDFHAQAGMLFSFLSRQPHEQQAYAFLMYGDGKERESAAAILAKDLTVPKHLSNREDLKKALLAKTVRECAKRLGISNYKAWRTKQACHGMLEPIALRLYNDIEDRFGIVQ